MYKFQSVELLAGDQSLYREGPLDHLDQTRYRILVWTDGALENIHRRPDYEYWVKGRFFPQYRWTKPAKPVRDWAAEFLVGLYTSQDEFKAPDGKVYRYDPRDAMPYATATQLLETQIETKDGRKDLRLVRKVRDLENYGEIWYYTKVNEDNAWSDATGGPRQPDARGRWPLRDNGWGHGLAWDVAGRKQTRQHNWHRYGAWSGSVAALEAGVPQAEQAWQVMLPLAGAQGEYDMELVPRIGRRAGREE